jgi:hypothetical protein
LLYNANDISSMKSGALFASEITEHIRLLMGLLRNIAFENVDSKQY